MRRAPAPEMPGEPIAIVGLACRFPDAAGAAEFLELVVTGRRAFRRVPPVRLDVGDYEAGPDGPGPAAPAAEVIGTARAALIEGWRFDRAAFGITEAAYRAADPAHWLALETAARALADGGFPGGQGLTRDRTGVIIGNTLTGEVSRASTMRSRWPYVRRVLREALAAESVSADRQAGVMEHAAAGFLDPFPEIGDESLAGSLPGAIADRICGHFGFRGGGHAVDATHSSSLLAVAAACSALAAGDLDAAVAGGVDISLDPFELTALSMTGALATGEMRVFDARPTGFWLGEGCGLVVLMRAADARAAGVPAYAEIAGWGVSSAGNPALTRPGSASLLLALRRAYTRAGIDPAGVALIEGDGTGTPSGDLAELTSLAEIRQGCDGLAAIGSVKASIGHTKAAAGAAGLIKATLAVAAGVIPPATGCVRPHPLIASEDARLRVPREPEPWPEGVRLAGVSSVGPGGTSVHVILKRAREGRRRRAPGGAGLPGGLLGGGRHAAHPGRGAPAGDLAPASAGGSQAKSAGKASPPDSSPGGASQMAASGRAGRRGAPGGRARAGWEPAAPAPRTEVFAFSAADRAALARALSRVADLAPWLSDGELHDLACQAGRAPGAGPVRACLVAQTQDQLARLAREAVSLLPGLAPGELVTAPGVFAADGARGRVTLLFSGEGPPVTEPATPLVAGDGSYDQASGPAVLAASLAGLDWLDWLGVRPVSAVGYGLGEIAGLVWAGCLAGRDAARLVAQRAAVLATPPPERMAMMCVDAGRHEAERLCAGTGLVIAAYNGPRCHVLAGPATAVRDLARRLPDDGVPARLLDSQHGFNSAAMADRVAPLRSVLRDFAFRPPVRRLVSTVTAAELAAGDDLPALLCRQLTSPVLFADALEVAV
jgi:enediyne polyketide synthase